MSSEEKKYGAAFTGFPGDGKKDMFDFSKKSDNLSFSFGGKKEEKKKEEKKKPETKKDELIDNLFGSKGDSPS